MARVTHVKKAQQRYATVPVLNPETGEPQVVPVCSADGSPKLTKNGKPIVRRVTVEDKSQPLPNHTCDRCGKEIEVGQSYKWIEPKSGPYGGSKRFRCAECPSWEVWEYSSSTSARVAQIVHEAHTDFDSTVFETADDVTSFLSSVAEQIRELASEKEEAADSIEEGFGHETYVSTEIREVAEQLNDWADNVEGADIPEYPEIEEEIECETCGGSGQLDLTDESTEEDKEQGYVECQDCEGTGTVENPEPDPSEEQLDDWHDQLSEVISVVDEAPF